MCVASGAHECCKLQQFISPCLLNCKLDMHKQYIIQPVLRLSFLLPLQLHLVVDVVEAGDVGGEGEEGEGEEEEADASIHSLLHVSKTSFSCSTIAHLLDDFFMLWRHLYE